MDGIADSRALQRSGHRQGCVAVKRIASRIGQHRSVRLTAMLSNCALLSAAPNEVLATDPGGISKPRRPLTGIAVISPSLHSYVVLPGSLCRSKATDQSAPNWVSDSA